MKDLIEKRDIKITCRITRTVEAIINSYDGESLGDKICSMAKIVQHLSTHGILEDRLKLMKEIENLNETLELINKAHDKLIDMNRRYTEELVEKERKIIKLTVFEEGYLADEYIVKKMLRLNELTGVDNKVKDVYEMYKSKNYASNEIGDCVEDLAKAFMKQEEREKQAAEMAREAGKEN